MAKSFRLIEFLKSGEFFDISIGDSKDKVISSIGKPHKFSYWSGEFSQQQLEDEDNWSYGAWVLSYKKGRLNSIEASLTTGEPDLTHPKASDLFDYKNMTLDDLATKLSELGINYFIVPKRIKLRDSEGGLFEKRRRLSAPTVYAGEPLATRVLFEDGKIGRIGYPASIYAQAVGAEVSKRYQEKGWSLAR